MKWKTKTWRLSSDYLVEWLDECLKNTLACEIEMDIGL
jgi:hypothetical protein